MSYFYLYLGVGSSWAWLNKAGGVVVWQQRSDILGHFRSKSDQRGLLCRVVRHVSSQLTRLSGDFGIYSGGKITVYSKDLTALFSDPEVAEAYKGLLCEPKSYPLSQPQC